MHVQLPQHRRRPALAALKQPISDFSSSSFTHSSLLSSEGRLPASQLYNQALHFYLIDRCYFLFFVVFLGASLGGVSTVCFYETSGKDRIPRPGDIYAWDGFVNVGLQLHGGSAWNASRRFVERNLEKLDPATGNIKN